MLSNVIPPVDKGEQQIELSSLAAHFIFLGPAFLESPTPAPSLDAKRAGWGEEIHSVLGTCKLTQPILEEVMNPIGLETSCTRD
jgi:hypothetical protein